jgi:predicted MFS family arabinose efflux permease
MRPSERTRTVSALGVIEIFAWGSTYYLMAVLAGPMAAETGWSAGLISAGISVGLLVSGLAAPMVGRLIHATGGRRVLAAGMCLIAAGLVILGSARTPPVYFAAWTVLGLGMSAGLYDAAFSALGRLYGRDARAAITQLTLWGGFASTVCWPITAWLVESVGWRGACLSYAALHLAITLPLSLFLMPRTPPADETSHDATAGARAAPGLLDLRFLCIAAAGVALTMVATVWSIHLVTILTAEGYTLAAAIAVGTLIGPAQVGARVLEMLGRGRHHPIWTMAAATTLVLLGFLGLRLGVPAAVALVAYGAGNGLWSIARGALPLALFGPGSYARTMGRLATPMLLAGAAAPTVGGLFIETFGPDGTLSALAAVSAVPCVAALILASTISCKRKISAVWNALIHRF